MPCMSITDSGLWQQTMIKDMWKNSAQEKIYRVTYIKQIVPPWRELGMTSEEGRQEKVRYDAFSDTAEKICAGGAARRRYSHKRLAHNANDQAETILFRILRGTEQTGCMEFHMYDVMKTDLK